MRHDDYGFISSRSCRTDLSNTRQSVKKKTSILHQIRVKGVIVTQGRITSLTWFIGWSRPKYFYSLYLVLYYLCKVFFSKYSLSSQMSIQLFRNWQTRCKNENELYYARRVYFLMVAYYDLLLLHLDKLIAEIKQSFNEMKTCYINIWTVGQGWSNISHVTARMHRARCVVQKRAWLCSRRLGSLFCTFIF